MPRSLRTESLKSGLGQQGPAFRIGIYARAIPILSSLSARFARRSPFRSRGFFGPGSIGFSPGPRRRTRIPRPLRRGLLMNDLADAVEVLVQRILGAFESALAEVDRVGQDFAGFLHALRIAARFQLNAFAFEERVKVFVNFVFINWFHKFPMLTLNIAEGW